MPLTPDAIDRLAAAVNILRPDWSQTGLRKLLGDGRIKIRQPRDVAVALVWVATDPQSIKPTRILEHGPWWEAAKPTDGRNSRTSPRYRTARWDDCHACGQPKASHVDDDHRYEEPPRGPVGMPDELRKALAEIRTAPPPPVTQEEEPMTEEPTTTEKETTE